MIQVQNLNYSYPNTTASALKNLSFDIAKGEVFGFLGPSGSGKSTTQKILYKLLSGYTGSVKIEGQDLSQWGRAFYHKIGVGFELPNHYQKLSALENLQFFAAFYKQQYAPPMDMLALVGLEEHAHKRVGDYSKGMKMRLNFVRAFMHNPDILFLDEPTSGLDPTNAQLIKTLIKKLSDAGKTIFLTTHQMYDADALCHRVAFLADGAIMALDTPEALKLRYARQQLKVSTKNGYYLDFDMNNIYENQEFMQILKNNDLQTIHSQEATLEDVFVAVTGKQLH